MDTSFKKPCWSLAIPAEVARELGLTDGEEVEVRANGKSARLPVNQRWRYDADAMIAAITEENCHPATDWGPPVGRERFWEDEETQEVTRTEES